MSPISLAGLLLGVAFVLQGCGSKVVLHGNYQQHVVGTKTCSNGVTVTFDCSGSTLTTALEATVDKDVCARTPDTSQDAPANGFMFHVKISCQDGKATSVMTTDVPNNAQCMQSGMNQALDEVCALQNPFDTYYVQSKSAQVVNIAPETSGSIVDVQALVHSSIAGLVHIKSDKRVDIKGDEQIKAVPKIFLSSDVKVVEAKSHAR